MPVTTTRHCLLTFSLLAPFVLSFGANAQIRPSERGMLVQTIDGTKISIDYARPRGRNRDPLFGNKDIVQWNEVWTPGANDATTLAITAPIKLDGHPIPKGTYSVWMVVRQSGDWTFVLDTRTTLWHTAHPDSNGTQIRFPIHTTEAPYLDVVTWSIPELRNEGGTLVMQWGKTKVAMRLDVEPTVAATLTEADALPYIGNWEFVQPGRAKPLELQITYDNHMLKGYIPAEKERMVLVRVATDWFATAVLDDKGEIWQVNRPGIVYEFTRANGRAVSYEVRDSNDKLTSSGVRKP
ncbi:MAG: DUF2911 domain-containing protein [bacterium]